MLHAPGRHIIFWQVARSAVLAVGILASPGLASAGMASAQPIVDIVKNTVDAAVDNAVTRKVEATVENTVVGKVTDQVVGNIAGQVESSVVGQVTNQITSKVEYQVDQLVSGVVDNRVTQSIANSLDRSLTPVTDRLDPLVDPLTSTLDKTAGKIVDTAGRVVEAVNKKLPAVFGREIQVTDNWRAVEHEWLALVTPDQIPALTRTNVTIISQTRLAATGQVLIRVRVSDQDEVAGRAQAILRGLGATAADRNHVYLTNKGPAPYKPSPSPAPAPQASYGGKAKIGLIDTAINVKHSTLKKANIVEKDFVDGDKPRPLSHGTAIASLLVGGEKDHEGLMPKAQLVSASVFYSGDKGAGGATTSSLIQSLDWMASQHVAVVNMSLAGPPNEVLGAMIAKLSSQGMLIVAAVGNDGPASRPLYPAAFEPVVAVTAVDRNSKVYRWANQGPQVDVAAFGVDATVANDKGGYDAESGTSFAAPIVAAALAELLSQGAKTTTAAYKTLVSTAQDLGPPGRDDIYGYGLVKPAALQK